MTNAQTVIPDTLPGGAIHDVLRPGAKIFLIVAVDHVKDRIDVRQTIVHDLDRTGLYLDQTQPPLLNSLVGHMVDAAFFHPNLATQRPWGYRATLKSLISHYHLNENQTTQALHLDLPRGVLAPTSIRMHYRLRIIPEFGVSAELEGAPGIRLIDVSLGGAKVYVPPKVRVRQRDERTFTFFFRNAEPIKAWARVIRVNALPEGKGLVLGLMFLEMEAGHKRALERAVNHLMRFDR